MGRACEPAGLVRRRTWVGLRYRRRVVRCESILIASVVVTLLTTACDSEVAEVGTPTSSDDALSPATTLIEPIESTVPFECPSERGDWQDIQSTADWVDFVRFGGRMYAVPEPSTLSLGELGERIGEVCFQFAYITPSDSYKALDGDAGWLPVGTALHALRGVDVSIQIAAVTTDGIVVYTAQSVPPPQPRPPTSSPVSPQPGTTVPLIESTGGADGPVIFRRFVENEEGMPAELGGELVLDGECLLLRVAGSDEPRTYVLLWPFGTHWRSESSTVVAPDGGEFTVGDSLELGGGMSPWSLIAATVSEPEALDLATRCADDEAGQNLISVN